MNQIKLMISDLDGTLLTTEKICSPATRSAIKRAEAGGTNLSFATGRADHTVRQLISMLDVSIPVIGGNGAYLLDQDQIYEQETIPSSAVEQALRIAQEAEECLVVSANFSTYCLDTSHNRRQVKSWSQIRRDASVIDRMNFKPDISSIMEDVRESVGQMVLYSRTTKTQAQVRAQIESSCEVQYACSGGLFSDMMKKGVSKGYMLKKLAEMLNIAREEILAFGDAENDLEMLEFAGIGVAMGNAEPLLKRHADAVTLDNDHDGVARAIEKYVL